MNPSHTSDSTATLAIGSTVHQLLVQVQTSARVEQSSAAAESLKDQATSRLHALAGFHLHGRAAAA
jgi:hypothetical protein